MACGSKKDGQEHEALTTSRSNYEVEASTLPYIDDANSDYDLKGKTATPAKRLSQVVTDIL